jgi:hypothetical protein
MFRTSTRALVLGLFVSSSWAGTILNSNLGPGMSYSGGNVFQIESVDGSGVNPPNKVWAVEFSPTVTSPFADAIVALRLFSGTNQLFVSLARDNNDAPGAVLEQISVTGLAASTAGGLVTASSVLNPVLTAGTPYWLVLSAPTPDTAAFWFWNSSGDFPAAPPGHPGGSNLAVSNTGPSGPWILEPLLFFNFPGIGTVPLSRTAFQIDGTVPEPSTVLLVISGLTLMAAKIGKTRGRLETATLKRGYKWQRQNRTR